jgi:CheY-like chemotaxis protein
VLVVDDDVETIERYKRYLAQRPYNIIGVTDAAQAIQAVHNFKPHAILLDLLMPGKSSWSIIQELRADPQTRDVAILACNTASAAGHGFSMGISDYVVKPVTSENLAASLARLGDLIQPRTAKESDDPLPLHTLVVADASEYKLVQQALDADDQAYQFSRVSSEAECAALIHEQEIDLIILDLMMSETDSFKVLELLKRTQGTRNVPVILLMAQELSEQEHAQLNGKVVALFQKELFEESALLQDVNVTLYKTHKHQSPLLAEEQVEE